MKVVRRIGSSRHRHCGGEYAALNLHWKYLFTGDPPMTSKDAPVGYASPPCLAHDVEPDPVQVRDVARWRHAARARLIATRMAVPMATRRAHDAAIAARLDAEIGDVRGLTISAWWPFRAEPDLRAWMTAATARGATCALPVVVEKGAPLIFRAWAEGTPLVRGVWNIPVPADGPSIVPDIVLAPVVGFDPSCYRLGYGGGFFDRTLAALASRPRALGIGYALAALATIFPQPHDIAMAAVLTETASHRPAR